MTQSTTGLVEAHGEALFVLSDKLRDRGFFDSAKNGEIYERVVSTFQALSTQETTIAELVAALERARAVFRHYEQLHAAKGTIDGCEKAVANALLAAEMENALTKSRSAL